MAYGRGFPLNRKRQSDLQKPAGYAEFSTVKVYINVDNISMPERFINTGLFGLFMI